MTARAAGQACGLELTVIGAGTVLPAASRSPSCHLLRAAERSFIFDLGPGALARLSAAGMDYREIDTLFVSHLHPDHVLDIVTLLQATNATPGWHRTRPLRLFGCFGLTAFLSRLLAVFTDAKPETYRLEITELKAGRHDIADMPVEVALTGHTANSLAFRLETGDGTFVYSGDATDGPALSDVAEGADIFLCECSFPEDRPAPDHLTSRSAGRLAHMAGVGHLVLTHTYPLTDHGRIFRETRQHYGGPLTIATDGTVVRC